VVELEYVVKEARKLPRGVRQLRRGKKSTRYGDLKKVAALLDDPGIIRTG